MVCVLSALAKYGLCFVCHVSHLSSVCLQTQNNKLETENIGKQINKFRCMTTHGKQISIRDVDEDGDISILVYK